ncbi:MAG: hypothetical protein ACE5HC_17245, partial [Candidatus Binatia bacterium]
RTLKECVYTWSLWAGRAGIPIDIQIALLETAHMPDSYLCLICLFTWYTANSLSFYHHKVSLD